MAQTRGPKLAVQHIISDYFTSTLLSRTNIIFSSHLIFALAPYDKNLWTSAFTYKIGPKKHVENIIAINLLKQRKDKRSGSVDLYQFC